MMRAIVSVLFTALVSACACQEEVNTVSLLESKPGQSVQAVSDQALASAFQSMPFSGDQYAVNWYANSIEITTFRGLFIPGMIDTVADYKKTDSSQDIIAKQFIAIAKKRGQTIKIYDAKANKAIVGCVRQRPAENTTLRSDIDPTLVAYDEKGNMVAALVRIHRFNQHMVTKNHFVVSKIYLGSLARDIELQLGGKQLRKQLLRTI